jgi:quercetin dioxygenase-like cupin family protein
MTIAGDLSLRREETRPIAKYPLPLLAALLIACSALQAQTAQPPGVTRTELQRHDLGMSGREAIQVRVALAPGVAFPDHSHPGEEIIYVLEGSLEYRVDGRPVTLGPGGVLFIPAGIVHSARNVGSTHADELATYIVEKGRPLVVLAQ